MDDVCTTAPHPTAHPVAGRRAPVPTQRNISEAPRNPLLIAQQQRLCSAEAKTGPGLACAPCPPPPSPLPLAPAPGAASTCRHPARGTLNGRLARLLCMASSTASWASMRCKCLCRQHYCPQKKRERVAFCTPASHLERTLPERLHQAVAALAHGQDVGGADGGTAVHACGVARTLAGE